MERVFFIFLLVTSHFGFYASLEAQEPVATDVQIEATLQVASQLLHSNKNDSALIVVQGVLNQLDNEEQMLSRIGLKAQLIKGQSLEQDNKNSEAVTLLNTIKAESEEKEYWHIFAESCFALSKVHLKMYRSWVVKEHLEEAQGVIQTYQLKDLEGQLARQRAYWHLEFGDPDSIIYFANQVLSAPSEEENPILDFDRLLLRGEYIREFEGDFNKSIASYLQAVKIAKDIKDYSRLSYIWNLMAKEYLNQHDISKALVYNDSTIHASYQAIQAGHEEIFSLVQAYQTRGNIYKTYNQWDSAYHYIKRGLTQEIRFKERLQAEKVAEIDASFQDEQKNMQILRLSDEVEQERKSRLVAFGFVFLILIFGGILLFYYYQLRKAKQKTEEHAQRLAELGKAKSRFFANISHELRTPLSLILGPINTLNKDLQVTGSQQRLLEMATQSGNQLEQLVNEILDLSKLEMGKMKVDLKPTMLLPFFKRYLTQFESLAQRKEIKYTYEFGLEPQYIALIDQAKCRQILYNLLSNAFKFTHFGGKIHCKIGSIGRHLNIEVKDNGHGIHPGDLHHVFERYFQTNQSDKPAEGGTGIGLALCREFAELMGGTIRVESDQDAGSTFQVMIPIEKVTDKSRPTVIYEPSHELEKEDIQQLRPAAVTTANHSDKPIILVVEDNPDLAEYIRILLENEYQVVWASNGKEALDKIHGTADTPQMSPQPDLVLSDLMMPVMDGYQLLQALKTGEDTRHLPVIMLTARADKDERLKALRIGVDDYLTKPFDEDELLAHLSNILSYVAKRNQDVKESDLEPLTSEDQVWLAEFEKLVQHHLANETLTVSFLAQEMAMSESSLLRQVKRLTGLTPKQYLQEVRLDAARYFLKKRTYRTIAKVADQVGYSRPRTFSRSFKKRYGKSPQAYLSD